MWVPTYTCPCERCESWLLSKGYDQYVMPLRLSVFMVQRALSAKHYSTREPELIIGGLQDPTPMGTDFDHEGERLAPWAENLEKKCEENFRPVKKKAVFSEYYL